MNPNSSSRTTLVCLAAIIVTVFLMHLGEAIDNGEAVANRNSYGAVVCIIHGFYKCAGTKIKPDFVLTTAHCVAQRNPMVSVVIFNTEACSFPAPKDAIVTDITSIKLHEEYVRSQNPLYDIAIIKHEQYPLDKISSLSFVNLDEKLVVDPTKNILKPTEQVNKHQEAILVGWGKTKDDPEDIGPTNLMYANFSVVPSDHCYQATANKDIKNRITIDYDRRQICADNFAKKLITGLPGDGGDPLFDKENNKQIGILISDSEGIVKRNRLIRISYFRNWIDKWSDTVPKEFYYVCNLLLSFV